MSISNTIRAGAAYVEVTAETSKLQRNLTSAQAQLQAFGRTCTTVGKDLLMFSGAMAVPLVMAAKSFAGFDDSMRLVQAVTQATDNDFKALTVTAQRLGRETSFTAQQVADAMVSLGRMGFAPAEIQKAIADVLNLARATGTELAEAGDIAANSLRIFGLEAEKMSNVSDVLTVTANSSAQTLTDLFEALKMGGPQAAAAGESIRETCASLAVLANLGIKGSLAGTALRKSFSQFAKVKVQDQLRSVGVETLDANGNLRKMAEIMRDIAKVMQTMPTAEKLAFAEDIFDIRGSLAGLTLTANTDELDAMMAKLLDVEGVAADTAQKMDAGLGGSFRLLMSAVEGAMNAIAAAMNGTLQPLITKVTDVINVFTQWIERNQGLVTAFAVVVAGAATLGVALIAIGVAAKGVAAGLAVVQTVTKGFAFVQGLCIAQATAMKSSILLIGQAFANYRNLAIPAMVGTEKFCMALGLASTAANRARASIILMSNAEAAAAAKSFLAAKWQAMTSALSAFRNSALAAAIATKAQGAAELALGARSAVVNGWLAMTNALKGMTVASVSATVTLKAQAAVEGAMNAGRSIATSWVAMTAALKGMTLASVGTVIALKAQAAAEAVCTASTAALNAVRSAGIAIVTAFTAVNLKSVIATGAVTAGNFLLATAAKVAAGAMLALSAVMSFIAAHPVAIALIALTAILGGVCIALYKAGNYTAKLSDEASKLREKGDELRKTDQVRMERLQQLAQKQKLTNAEMAEARILAGKLQKKYGDLGISVTDNTMRIKALSEAVSTLEALELKVHDNGELQKIQRLKDLSLKVNLSVDEQNEASSLIESLSLHFGDLGLEVDRAKKKVIALSDSAKRLGGGKLGVQLAMEDLPKFDKLKTLSMELELTVPQQDEAQRLIAELSAKYGELGVHVNRTTGQIEKLNTVAGSITDLRFRIRGQEDILKLFRLQDLSFQGELTISGQEEAKSLLDDLSSKYGELGLRLDEFSKKIVAVNAVSGRISAVALEVTGMDEIQKVQRLKDFTLKTYLNTEELTEAQSLIDAVGNKYGELGLTVDRTKGMILDLNASAASLQGVALRVEGTEDLSKLQKLMALASDNKLDPDGLTQAAALIETLEGKYGSLAVAVDRVQGRVVTLSEAAFHLKAVNLEIRSKIEKPDLPKFDELQSLTLKMNLDARDMSRAESLIAQLEQKYGSLGVSIDQIRQKITKAHSVAGQMIELKYKVRGQEDIDKFQKLKDLSLQAKLDVEGQKEASALIADLEKRYGSLGLRVDAVAGKLTAFNQKSARLDDIQLKVTNTEDLEKFRKLKDLSLKVELSTGELAEAETLISDLGRKYGELGVHVDRSSGKIVKLNSVIGSIRDLHIRVRGEEDIAKVTQLGKLAKLPTLDAGNLAVANTLIAQLRSKYGELGISVDAASGRIVALTAAQIRFAQAHERIKGGNDPMKDAHLAQLERLQKLAAQEKLTADEQREAQNILTSLNGAYNNLGLGIDSICGKLNVATDAQKKFNNAMKESALAQLDAEIAEYESNIQELQRENESLDSYRNHNLVSQLSGRQDETLRKQAANLDRILVLRQKIAATQKRRKAVQAEKKEAYTGEKAPAVPTTEDKVRQERTRSSKDQELVANAESRVKEIEKRLKRERQTDLENEIEDIIALRDEYKKLIQTMLTFEKSKKNSDQQKIADLEKKLAQADKTAEERIAKAKEKEAQKLQKDVSSYKERFAETEKSVRERRAEEKTDREVDTQLETDPDAGAERLKQLIAQYQKAATDAKAQFQLELTSAQKDGKIDDTERGKIDAAMQAYSRAESMVDKYSAKLNSAQKGTQEASEDVENTRQIGSFLAASLDSMLGGSSDSTRTANATEMVAKYSKETNRLLKKMNMQNSTSSLTYT